MPTISDINAECRSLCDATSSDYADAVLLRRINKAYEDIVSKILCYDGFWQFDDSNYTDRPEGTGNLIAEQHDYAYDITLLKIIGVSVKDINGLWQKLEPIDQSEMGDDDPSEFFKVDGMPKYYDKNGNSLIIYPAPSASDVTLTAGLKVYFQRTADIFTSAEVSTGTKVPGFASPFHYLLSYKAAVPYCATYKKDRVQMLLNEIAIMEKDMERFYTKRAKDERPIITMKPIIFR